MKYRTKARLKSKKRRSCPANILATRHHQVNRSTDVTDVTVTAVLPTVEMLVTEDNSSSSIQSEDPVQFRKSFTELVNRSKEKLDMNSTLLESRTDSNVNIINDQSTMSYNTRSKLPNEIAEDLGNSIITLPILAKAIETAAICSKCKHPRSKLILREDKAARNGLAQKLMFMCSICNVVTDFFNSEKDYHKPFQVNTKSVHLSCQGMGLAGLKKMTAILNLPPPVNSGPYNKIVHELSTKAIEQSSLIMKSAASRLYTAVEKNNPDKIIEITGKKVAKIAVSVDGTWQRRGHSSKIGAVFIISVDTGEILDAVVKSLTCTECMKKDSKSLDYEEWFKKHRVSCNINHEGSSGNMEASAAIEMFLRSVDERGLLYETFVGDGDTDCFGSVKEACQDFDPLYIVEKEECVGHVQKRLGHALREFKRRKRGIKLKDGKSVGGRNRLTDVQIDKMQNHFGEAIRNHPNDLPGMTKAIYAILDHMVVNNHKPLEKQHENCPRAGWCKFWSSKEQYNEGNRLPTVFYQELKPIFDRLSNESLLKRCLQGLTQNQNESANSVLWSRCPKTKFCGAVKVRLAVAETVCQFNAGMTSFISLKQAMKVNVSQQSIKTFQSIDRLRIANAARKISEKARLIRRMARAKKHQKSKVQVKSYISGAFGTKKVPDKVVKSKLTKKQTKNRAKKSLVDVKFIDQTLVEMNFHVSD